MKRVSRRMKGRGLVSFIRKAVGFLRKHHVISKVANFAGSVLPGKYGSIASSVGKTAGSVGFGRRRRRRGRGLRLAGGHGSKYVLNIRKYSKYNQKNSKDKNEKLSKRKNLYGAISISPRSGLCG